MSWHRIPASHCLPAVVVFVPNSLSQTPPSRTGTIHMPRRVKSLLYRAPLGRGNDALKALQYVPVGQGTVPPGSHRPRVSVSRRRHLPWMTLGPSGMQDQFSGHITTPPLQAAALHGSSAQIAPFATLKLVGWGAQKSKHLGSSPSSEVVLRGSESGAQSERIDPGFVQLADSDRARLEGLHRAPISAGVRVNRTMARILPPPSMFGRSNVGTSLRCFRQANA